MRGMDHVNSARKQ